MRERFYLTPASRAQFGDDTRTDRAFVANLAKVGERIGLELPDRLVFFEEGDPVPQSVVDDERTAETLVQQGIGVLNRTDLTAQQKVQIIRDALCPTP